MLKHLLVLLLVGVQLSWAQYPKYSKFPVGRGNDTECYDYQVGKKYTVGDVWSSPYSGCKLSYCIKENGVLFIDRYRCPYVRKLFDFKKAKAHKYYCKLAWGDRRQSFPECCSTILCKHFVKGKLIPIPKHLYPLL